MRTGGNFGDYMDEDFDPYPSNRWRALVAYQFMVWCIISIIILNLVLGIIVDVSQQYYACVIECGCSML